MDANLSLRPLQLSDLPAAMRLKEAAHWNQIEEDWQIILSQSSPGHFAAIEGEHVAGSATTLPYGTFCWIGMVLVDPDYRRKGIGKALLEACIDAAEQHQMGWIGLDATPAGKQLYDTLGFKDDATLARYRRPELPIEKKSIEKVRPIKSDDWEKVLLWDKKVFGADRSHILKHLSQRLDGSAIVYEDQSGIQGYSFLRPGSTAVQLGPIVAGETSIAQRLIDYQLQLIEGKESIVDIFDHQKELIEWSINERSFKVERPFIRMSKGRLSPSQLNQDEFAIAGPELA